MTGLFMLVDHGFCFGTLSGHMVLGSRLMYLPASCVYAASLNDAADDWRVETVDVQVQVY